MRKTGNTFIANPVDHEAPVLTAKQRQKNAVAMIDRWLLEDEDDHAKSLKVIAESVDFPRRGYRTLFD